MGVVTKATPSTLGHSVVSLYTITRYRRGHIAWYVIYTDDDLTEMLFGGVFGGVLAHPLHHVHGDSCAQPTLS